MKSVSFFKFQLWFKDKLLQHKSRPKWFVEHSTWRADMGIEFQTRKIAARN